MKLLITLLDIADFTAFSTNISPAQVTPYIKEAHTFDVKLPLSVRLDLEASLLAVDKSFKPDDVETVEFEGAAAAAGWDNMPLARAWYQAIRPLLALESARRMLLWHGLHITPNAAEITTDRPISSQQRAELRADLQSKAAHYRSLYEVSLRTLLPVSFPACGSALRRPSNGGFRSSAI